MNAERGLCGVRRALSDQTRLSLYIVFRSLQRCKIPSVISTAHREAEGLSRCPRWRVALGIAAKELVLSDPPEITGPTDHWGPPVNLRNRVEGWIIFAGIETSDDKVDLGRLEPRDGEIHVRIEFDRGLEFER